MVFVAVFGHKLDSDSLYAVVKLIAMMTHSNELVIETCYLYCYAIKQLINGSSAKETFNMTKQESKRRAEITGMSRIRYWIENDIEASA
jgi:ADP-ribosylglycohydrolase